MKKHIHGKRHSIARRSVAIGRDKKKIRKINRWIALIERIDWEAMARRMASAVINPMDAFARVVEKIVDVERSLYN